MSFGVKVPLRNVSSTRNRRYRCVIYVTTSEVILSADAVSSCNVGPVYRVSF